MGLREWLLRLAEWFRRLWNREQEQHQHVGIVLPGGRVERSIVVETRQRTRIENVQEPEVGPQQIAGDNRFRQKYRGPGVIFRTDGPSGMYNCNGLTFASRRTQIRGPADVLKVLEEDGYREVALDRVRPGDVVVYFGKQDDPMHSGVVTATGDLVPMVCSKWATLSEVLHPLNNCPYMEDVGGRGIKFYRVWI